MEAFNSLLLVGSVIIAGLIAHDLFKRYRLPDALILMLIGAGLAFFGVGKDLRNDGMLSFLIIFSLIYVVFWGALPIRIDAVFSTLRNAVLASLASLASVTLVIGVIAYLLGFPLQLALALGALFCVLDGSLINSILETVKTSKDLEAAVQTESAIVDILVIITVVSIVQFQSTQASGILQLLSTYVFLSFGIGLVMALVWSFVLHRLGDHASAPIATMAMLVMVYGFAEFTKANGVITIFVFAIIMGNLEHIRKLLYPRQAARMGDLDLESKSFFRDISFLIRTFLFVYMGILIDVVNWPWLVVGAGFFAIAFVIRSVIIQRLTTELSASEVKLLQALSAKGLTPIVLLQVMQTDAITSNIVIGGVAFSIFMTSTLVFFIERKRPEHGKHAAAA